MPIDPHSADGISRFSEFLADYFVECDEHLSVARRVLLGLEGTPSGRGIERSHLDELFRCFHSLKGLSAMVGFHEAEQLGHHVETYLGAVRRRQATLTGAGIDSLLASVVAIEQAIAARRDSTALPDTGALLQKLSELLPVVESAAPPAVDKPALGDKQELIQEKLQAGARIWQVRFAPTPELSAAGVNVNSLRKRLQELGDIVHSAPLVGKDGKIEFYFLLVAQAEDSAVQSLAGEGTTCSPYAPPKETPQPPADVPEPTQERSSTHLTPANVVRVDLTRLDELMRLVGELVLSRARLEDGIKKLQADVPDARLRSLKETAATIERQLRDLREGVMQIRMVAVRDVFVRMQFVVRDLTREIGKKVVLHLSGEETQIDKYIVERFMDPLLHLVRNAVSHGIEYPAERLAAGKPEEGTLFLRARTTGEMVVIEVEDDGQGIDAERVYQQAREKGILGPDPNAADFGLLDVLCTPGFSTRTQVDRVSGRGVGMDVVRQSARELGGSLSLFTEPGRGSRFEIQLPLTVAITEALIVKVGDQRYAVPQAAVREIIRLESDSLLRMENNELFRYRRGALPLVRLAQRFGLEEVERDHLYALIIGDGTQALGIAVDRVLGLQEIVVRPLTDEFVQVPEVAGATELGDGRVILILDTASFIRGGRRTSAQEPGVYTLAPKLQTGVVDGR